MAKIIFCLFSIIFLSHVIAATKLGKSSQNCINLVLINFILLSQWHILDISNSDIFLDCCEFIILSGGNFNASRDLEYRTGKFEFHYSTANNKSLYIQHPNSTNSSIAFGDNAGWRVSYDSVLLMQCLFYYNYSYGFSKISIM